MMFYKDLKFCFVGHQILIQAGLGSHEDIKIVNVSKKMYKIGFFGVRKP